MYELIYIYSPHRTKRHFLTVLEAAKKLVVSRIVSTGYDLLENKLIYSH
ncbi:hypothetical protein BH23PAT2_BH23PAT2_03510 [soil metagenome]